MTLSSASDEFLKRKFAALREARIAMFFVGDVTEVALMQEVSENFYTKIKQLGAEAMEGSGALITMSPHDGPS